MDETIPKKRQNRRRIPNVIGINKNLLGASHKSAESYIKKNMEIEDSKQNELSNMSSSKTQVFVLTPDVLREMGINISALQNDATAQETSTQPMIIPEPTHNSQKEKQITHSETIKKTLSKKIRARVQSKGCQPSSQFAAVTDAIPSETSIAATNETIISNKSIQINSDYFIVPEKMNIKIIGNNQIITELESSPQCQTPIESPPFSEFRIPKSPVTPKSFKTSHMETASIIKSSMILSPGEEIPSYISNYKNISTESPPNPVFDINIDLRSEQMESKMFVEACLNTEIVIQKEALDQHVFDVCPESAGLISCDENLTVEPVHLSDESWKSIISSKHTLTDQELQEKETMLDVPCAISETNDLNYENLPKPIEIIDGVLPEIQSTKDVLCSEVVESYSVNQFNSIQNNDIPSSIVSSDDIILKIDSMEYSQFPTTECDNLPTFNNENSDFDVLQCQNIEQVEISSVKQKSDLNLLLDSQNFSELKHNNIELKSPVFSLGGESLPEKELSKSIANPVSDIQCSRENIFQNPKSEDEIKCFENMRVANDFGSNIKIIAVEKGLFTTNVNFSARDLEVLRKTLDLSAGIDYNLCPLEKVELPNEISAEESSISDISIDTFTKHDISAMDSEGILDTSINPGASVAVVNAAAAIKAQPNISDYPPNETAGFTNDRHDSYYNKCDNSSIQDHASSFMRENLVLLENENCNIPTSRELPPFESVVSKASCMAVKSTIKDYFYAENLRNSVEKIHNMNENDTNDPELVKINCSPMIYRMARFDNLGKKSNVICPMINVENRDVIRINDKFSPNTLTISKDNIDEHHENIFLNCLRYENDCSTDMDLDNAPADVLSKAYVDCISPEIENKNLVLGENVCELSSTRKFPNMCVSKFESNLSTTNEKDSMKSINEVSLTDSVETGKEIHYSDVINNQEKFVRKNITSNKPSNKNEKDSCHISDKTRLCDVEKLRPKEINIMQASKVSDSFDSKKCRTEVKQSRNRETFADRSVILSENEVGHRIKQIAAVKNLPREENKRTILYHNQNKGDSNMHGVEKPGGKSELINIQNKSEYQSSSSADDETYRPAIKVYKVKKNPKDALVMNWNEFNIFSEAIPNVTTSCDDDANMAEDFPTLVPMLEVDFMMQHDYLHHCEESKEIHSIGHDSCDMNQTIDLRFISNTEEVYDNKTNILTQLIDSPSTSTNLNVFVKNVRTYSRKTSRKDSPKQVIDNIPSGSKSNSVKPQMKIQSSLSHPTEASSLHSFKNTNVKQENKEKTIPDNNLQFVENIPSITFLKPKPVAVHIDEFPITHNSSLIDESVTKDNHLTSVDSMPHLNKIISTKDDLLTRDSSGPGDTSISNLEPKFQSMDELPLTNLASEKKSTNSNYCEEYIETQPIDINNYLNNVKVTQCHKTNPDSSTEEVMYEVLVPIDDGDEEYEEVYEDSPQNEEYADDIDNSSQLSNTDQLTDNDTNDINNESDNSKRDSLDELNLIHFENKSISVNFMSETISEINTIENSQTCSKTILSEDDSDDELRIDISKNTLKQSNRISPLYVDAAIISTAEQQNSCADDSSIVELSFERSNILVDSSSTQPAVHSLKTVIKEEALKTIEKLDGDDEIVESNHNDEKTSQVEQNKIIIELCADINQKDIPREAVLDDNLTSTLDQPTYDNLNNKITSEVDGVLNVKRTKKQKKIFEYLLNTTKVPFHDSTKTENHITCEESVNDIKSTRQLLKVSTENIVTQKYKDMASHRNKTRNENDILYEEVDTHLISNSEVCYVMITADDQITASGCLRKCKKDKSTYEKPQMNQCDASEPDGKISEVIIELCPDEILPMSDKSPPSLNNNTECVNAPKDDLLAEPKSNIKQIVGNMNDEPMDKITCEILEKSTNNSSCNTDLLIVSKDNKVTSPSIKKQTSPVTLSKINAKDLTDRFEIDEKSIEIKNVKLHQTNQHVSDEEDACISHVIDVSVEIPDLLVRTTRNCTKRRKILDMSVPSDRFDAAHKSMKVGNDAMILKSVNSDVLLSNDTPNDNCKPKRGRKKKIIITEADTLNVSDSTNQLTNDSSETNKTSVEMIISNVDDGEVLNDSWLSIKPKRGRKKKILPNEFESNDVSDSMNQSIEDRNVRNETSVDTSVLNITDVLNDSEVSSKPKRGRKRKIIVKEPESDGIDLINQSMEDGKETSQTSINMHVLNITDVLNDCEVSSKPKRGRKRKNILKESESNVFDSINPAMNDGNETIQTSVDTPVLNVTDVPNDCEVSSKPKRGRKRKIVPNELESNDVFDLTNQSIKVENETSQTSVDMSISNVTDVLNDSDMSFRSKRVGKRKIMPNESECNYFSDLINQSKKDNEKNDVLNDSEVTSKPKRGRKRKIIANESNNVSNNFSDSMTQSLKDGNLTNQTSVDTDFSVSKVIDNSNSDLKQKKKYNKKLKDPSEIKPAKPNRKVPVTCGVCKMQVLLKSWDKHNFKQHKYLGWIEGEAPINMDDEPFVVTLLQKALNQSKKKLICPTCNMVRSSAVGYLAHMGQCQKTPEEVNALRKPCPICFRLMLPQSLKVHMPIHTKAAMVKPVDEVEGIEASNEGGRAKRKAAAKADITIKKLKDINVDDLKDLQEYYSRPSNSMTIGFAKRVWKENLAQNEPMVCPKSKCSFSDKSEEIMCEHFLKRCKYISSKLFSCKACPFKSDEAEMREHVTKEHSEWVNKDDEEESEDPSGGSETESKNPPVCKPVKKTDSSFISTDDVHKKPLVFASTTDFRQKYRTWTKDFEKNNFNAGFLFSDMLCNDFVELHGYEAEKFLPKERESCKIYHRLYSQNKKSEDPSERQWRTYSLFESDLFHDSLTLWCGGPVFAIGWVPGKKYSNYLAVATNPTMDYKLYENKCYAYNNIIQIWDVGVLSNKIAKCVGPARMVLGIAHEYGNVWDLDWCPSSCIEDANANLHSGEYNASDFPRMGLLAIACSNGSAYIYSVCDPASLPSSSGRNIYHTEPVAELRLFGEESDTRKLDQSQATKLMWSLEKGHSIIVVGYSSGIVAQFDITSKSPLLKRKLGNMSVFSPYHSFQPYMSPINGLVMIPRTIPDSGDVVIAASSIVGCTTWSGNTVVVNRKGRYTSAGLSPHWPNVLVCCENFIVRTPLKWLPNALVSISMRSVGNDDLSHRGGSAVPGSTSVSASWWNGHIIAAGTAGDIFIQPSMSHIVVPHRSGALRKQKKIALLSYPQMVSFSDKPAVPRKHIRSTEINCKQIIMPKNKDGFAAEPSNYKDTKDQYGLMFVDIPWECKKAMQPSGPKEGDVIVDRFSLQTVFCVKSHPSSSSHWFHAHGGRSGVVRIMCVKHLTETRPPTRKRVINPGVYF